MTITEFLLARIAEDEEVARSAIDSSGWGSSPDGRWRLVEVPYEGEWPRNPDAEHVMWAGSEWTIHASRHSPARILRECAAKREIIERHSHCDDVSYGDASTCPEVSTLAAVYAGHPDYQEEWRP